MVRNLVGPPVEGDDFYGRQHEIQHVWQLISSGNNIVLPAPRRVGKSSFAKKILTLAKEAGWDVVEINLESVQSENKFIESLIDNLKDLSWWEKIKESASNVLVQLKQIKPTVSYGEVQVGLEFTSIAKDIYEQVLKLFDHQKETLIYFDELTVLLSFILRQKGGKEKVENLLHWLRSIRQVSGSKIRWIICSSVGIENFAHNNGLSDTINDLQAYHLRPFDYKTSLGLIIELEKSSGIAFNMPIREAMLKKLQFYIPFFIQILFEKMSSLVNIDGHNVSLELVENAYKELLDQNQLNTWVERIEKQYGNYQTLAFVLLNHLCKQNQGSTRQSLLHIINSRINDIDKSELLLSKLLYMLGNDGYIFEDLECYHFRSPLLRDFWYKRFIE